MRTRASEGTAISMRRRYNLYMKLPSGSFSHGKYNPSFVQNTGIQKKFVATYKERMSRNRLRRILKELQNDGQEKPGETITETARFV
jgi:hypothetical protein